MRETIIILFLVALHVPQPAPAGIADRDEIVSRMQEFLDINLQTNEQVDDSCLAQNLMREEYTWGCNCSVDPNDLQPCCSDIYWHEDFLDSNLTHVGWWGMNYRYGGEDPPNASAVQAKLNNCYGAGAHKCHHDYGDTDAWAIGTDCSASVSYAGGIPREGTCGLDDDDVGVEIEWDNVRPGSYVNKCGSHVVLVKEKEGDCLTILEQTGGWPVGWQIEDRNYHYYSNLGYTPFDFIAVANTQGGDGVLLARLRADGSVKLTWRVDSAHDTRWYEFQYWDENAGMWVTFEEQDYIGPGSYQANYATGIGGDGALVFRLLENEWGGCRIPHSETKALAAR